MINRNFKESSSPTKNQELSIEYKGKVYAICSDDQMSYLLMTAKERIMMEDADKVYKKEKKSITEEELKAKLYEYVESCGYGTIASVLAKMTPAEQEEWKNKYRFTPITKCRQ